LKCERECDYRESLWLPPSFRLCYHYVHWLLKNWKDLDEGIYPPDPTSSYVGNSGKRQKAPFETLSLLRAEIITRLKKCGNEGWKVLVFAMFHWPEPEETHLVLSYISGSWPKKKDDKEIPYRNWKDTHLRQRGYERLKEKINEGN
jgi:hypothetical protein